MGTRSITVFTNNLDDPKEELCVLYRQFDGYPSGHGADLKACLLNAQIGNGIPGGLDLSNGSKFFNGMGDLAVQTITRLKKQEAENAIERNTVYAATGMPEKKLGDLEPGQFYLYKTGTRDCGEDYTYTVYNKDNKVYLKVEGYGGELYSGPVDNFDPDMSEECEC